MHAVNTDPERPAGIGPTRMRASLHQGLTCEGASGFLGTAVVELFRVLDAGPLRAALRESAHADLAVAWSDSLYRDLVPHAYPGLDERAFRQVQVDLPEKGFTAGAWIELRARPLGGERPAPAGTEAPDAGNGAPNPH
ncbi:Guanylate cyclase domain-containing protein OS=Streptomyces rimosus subsp. rimosus (strain ATCC / DSM 40260 / JCM 4667 / NRRL 2234) OX=1265868 GN=SRIM_037940 PE=4 SV=1 [Streptomyces rimosus subsp. rimosus]